MNLSGNPAAVRQFMRFCAVLEPSGSWADAEHRFRVGGDMAGVSQVSAALIIELMNDVSRRLQMPDIGFRFSSWLNPRGFGALGLLREHCGSLAEFYQIYDRFLYLENGALAHAHVREREEIALVYKVAPSLRPRATPMMDALVGLSVRTLRGLLGAAWRPLRVELERPTLPDRCAERTLGCDVIFDAGRHAVIIGKADFDRPLPDPNPELVRHLTDELGRRSMEYPPGFVAQTSMLVKGLLTTGVPQAANVAALLGMSHRTFQRRLSDEGTDFASILRDVRMAIIRSTLADNAQGSLGLLTNRLGYSEPSVTARFVRDQFGATWKSLRKTVK